MSGSLAPEFNDEGSGLNPFWTWHQQRPLSAELRKTARPEDHQFLQAWSPWRHRHRRLALLSRTVYGDGVLWSSPHKMGMRNAVHVGTFLLIIPRCFMPVPRSRTTSGLGSWWCGWETMKLLWHQNFKANDSLASSGVEHCQLNDSSFNGQCPSHHSRVANKGGWGGARGGEGEQWGGEGGDVKVLSNLL